MNTLENGRLRGRVLVFICVKGSWECVLIELERPGNSQRGADIFGEVVVLHMGVPTWKASLTK